MTRSAALFFNAEGFEFGTRCCRLSFSPSELLITTLFARMRLLHISRLKHCFVYMRTDFLSQVEFLSASCKYNFCLSESRRHLYRNFNLCIFPSNNCIVSNIKKIHEDHTQNLWGTFTCWWSDLSPLWSSAISFAAIWTFFFTVVENFFKRELLKLISMLSICRFVRSNLCSNIWKSAAVIWSDETRPAAAGDLSAPQRLPRRGLISQNPPPWIQGSYGE